MDRERGLCVRKLCEGLCCARGLYARGYVIAIALRGVTHLCDIQDRARGYIGIGPRGVTHLCAIQDRARGYIGIGPRGVTHLCAIQDLAVTFTDRPYAVMDGARVLHTRRFCS